MYFVASVYHIKDFCFLSLKKKENGEIYVNNKWMDAAVMGENNNDKCDALCNRVRPHTY